MKSFRILIGIMMFVFAVSLCVSSNASAQGQGGSGINELEAQVQDVKAVVDTIDTNTTGLGTAVGTVNNAVTGLGTTLGGKVDGLDADIAAGTKGQGVVERSTPNAKVPRSVTVGGKTLDVTGSVQTVGELRQKKASGEFDANDVIWVIEKGKAVQI